MDRLHQLHESVQEVWKFIKECENRQPHDEKFWNWAQDKASEIAASELSFISDWLISYMKFIEREDCIKWK